MFFAQKLGILVIWSSCFIRFHFLSTLPLCVLCFQMPPDSEQNANSNRHQRCSAQNQ